MIAACSSDEGGGIGVGFGSGGASLGRRERLRVIAQAVQRLQRLRPQPYRALQVFDGPVLEPLRQLDLRQIACQLPIRHLAFFDQFFRRLEKGDEFIDREALAHRDRAHREDGSQEAGTHYSIFAWVGIGGRGHGTGGRAGMPPCRVFEGGGGSNARTAQPRMASGWPCGGFSRQAKEIVARLSQSRHDPRF